MYSFEKLYVNVAKPVIMLVPKPTPVTYVGAGKVMKTGEILQMNNVTRVLIITDASLHKIGLVDPVIKSLKEAGISYVIYDGVKPDPSYSIVEEALDCCKVNACNGIVALGGGSVMDTAKVVNVAFTNHKAPQKLKGLLKVRKRGMPFIAIPTTAGTGSETTVAAVISDPVTHDKTQVLDPKIVPCAAILDPELTVGLPVSITAHTAMDALTHALEAYTNTYANSETDRFAEIAVKLIYENVVNVYNNPKDIKGREALLVASFYAGMAFTRTYVGYVHAFAHNIGGHFNVPHGLACAAVLPHVMEFFEPACEERFAKLCDLVGLSNKDDSVKTKCDKFIKSIYDLNDTLDIPKRLETFPKSAVIDMCKAGFKECHGTYPVPRYLAPREAQRMLNKICAKPR